jgi:hypothetical protein
MRKISRHQRNRGQPETKISANLNGFGNNQRIKYLDNQPHATTTKTLKTINYHHENGSTKAATTEHQRYITRPEEN